MLWLKFGKEFKKLSDKEGADIKKVYGSKKLRELARDSDRAHKFRIAYANAYADMSDRGIGILGVTYN